eukprot:TRINITY_DN919_c0_g1_i4.p1 TRINITY_DN919_c0_g1~~TRINITY_DN919_c0_g1_i4.p1  ORF type:complete len:107 (+),score=4.40 TRINITY_DN919_c0_g1_i4:387-707(+)
MNEVESDGNNIHEEIATQPDLFGFARQDVISALLRPVHSAFSCISTRIGSTCTSFTCDDVVGASVYSLATWLSCRVLLLGKICLCDGIPVCGVRKEREQCGAMRGL